MSGNRWFLAAILVVTCSAGVAHAADAEKSWTTLPLHDCEGLICMHADVNGAPFNLAVDTGDVDSVVMLDVAKAHGWKLTSAKTKEGKTMRGYYVTGPVTVSLNGMQEQTTFLVIDRKTFGAKPPPIDGTLAYPFFKNRVLRIDYPHQRLQISRIEVGHPDASLRGTLQLITFGKHGPPILVGSPFTVNGHSVHAQIDTMYTGSMVVYDDALAKLGLHKHGRPTFFPFTDSGVTMLAAPARKLGFHGNAITTDATVYFAGYDKKNPLHQPDGLFEATVGNALFAHSVLTLDFHSMRMEVQPSG